MSAGTVHASDCYQAIGPRVLAQQAARSHPYARPHGCVPGGFAVGMVVVVETEIPEHPYETSMIWPAGAPRALCRVCREDHP